MITGLLPERYASIPSFQPKLLTILASYYIFQLVRAVRLVNFASRISLYNPLNLKVSFPVGPISLRDIINILLTLFSRSVL